jgi:hypothetical protein
MTNDLPRLRAVPADPIAAAVAARIEYLQRAIAAAPDAWERTKIQSDVASCQNLLRMLALTSGHRKPSVRRGLFC